MDLLGGVLAGIGTAVAHILGEAVDSVFQNRPNFLRSRSDRQHTRAELEAAQPRRAYRPEDPDSSPWGAG